MKKIIKKINKVFFWLGFITGLTILAVLGYQKYKEIKSALCYDNPKSCIK